MVKVTVLVVDDSISAARQLTRILEETGEFLVVGHAKNGIEGIKLFNELRPEFVLMDLVMPEMDGMQAMRTIISLKEDAKVVVISSAAGLGEKVVEALGVGAITVLSKPFVPAKIIETLRNAVKCS